MIQQPSAALDTIQIRYRISYLTWLRMKALAQPFNMSISAVCNRLLDEALDDNNVPRDPNVLLGLEERDNG